jgi:hypothetical protein
VIAFRPEKERGRWQAARRSSDDLHHDSTAVETHWVRLVQCVNRARFQHNIARIADALERIAGGKAGRP